MEGMICFEYRWELKPVLVYALCHTKPIFDSDYHNKRSKTPNNMTSRKRISNTYWSTNTFAPSVAICIDQSICHRWRASICIGQLICHPESAAINSGFSKLRMEHFLRMDFHMKLLLGGTETFHRGNILVVLRSTISILAVCTYAYVHVWKLRSQIVMEVDFYYGCWAN